MIFFDPLTRDAIPRFRFRDGRRKQKARENQNELALGWGRGSIEHHVGYRRDNGFRSTQMNYHLQSGATWATARSVTVTRPSFLRAYCGYVCAKQTEAVRLSMRNLRLGFSVSKQRHNIRMNTKKNRIIIFQLTMNPTKLHILTLHLRPLYSIVSSNRPCSAIEVPSINKGAKKGIRR